MIDNRLISMVEFVLKSELDYTSQTTGFIKIKQYAKFLNQPLNIGQFVPAIDGGKWVVLEEPIDYNDMQEYGDLHQIEQNDLLNDQYQQAKDKVIFEGFEVEKIKDYYAVSFDGTNVWLSWTDRTIEKFMETIIPTLTKYGQQQAGL